MVRFRLELAIAQYNGTRETFAASIDGQVAELLAAEPKQLASPPAPDPRSSADATVIAQVSQAGPAEPVVDAAAPATPMLPPAGWYPNQVGEGQRWWDGSAWTEYTSP